MKNDIIFSRLEKKFEKEYFKEIRYKKLSEVRLEANYITSVNFIPKVVSEIKNTYHEDVNSLYYLCALFTFKILRGYLSKILERKMKNRVKEVLTEFCQNWVFYIDSAIPT